MASIGTASINVSPDLSQVELAMRVIARHLTACADELAEIKSAGGER